MIVMGFYKHLRTHEQYRSERIAPHAANMGLNEMASEALKQTVVLYTNFCGRWTVRASNPSLLYTMKRYMQTNDCLEGEVKP